MELTKKHTIFIDTKMDDKQKPSNFRVKVNNWFIRNNIKNNDGASNEWYMSVKTFSMFNSFSNITTGLNDKVILYVGKNLNSPELTFSDLSPSPGVLGPHKINDYDKYELTIPPGNPNVANIRDFLNTELAVYGIECIYRDYDSKYVFKNIATSTDKKRKYIIFENTFDLLGMEKDKLYLLDNAVNTKFESTKNVNLLADRLVKFSLGNNSDIRLKNTNYCNHMSVYDECNHFFLMPVNVQSYDLMYYQRTTEDLIPIELLGNTIRNIEILARNQDGGEIEGLSNYIMILELIQVKKWNYEKKIYDVLKQIYLWVASFLKWRI